MFGRKIAKDPFLTKQKVVEHEGFYWTLFDDGEDMSEVSALGWSMVGRRGVGLVLAKKRIS